MKISVSNYLFISLTFLTISLVAQTEENEQKLIQSDTITVHPDLPKYIIKVYQKEADFPKSVVKIYHPEDSTVIQTLHLDSGILDLADELLDINFDGYNDLEVYGYWMNTITGSISFWLFNPDLKIFEETKEFSNFGELTIDEEKLIIHDFSVSAGYNKSSWSATYKVVNHHLVLIEKAESYGHESYRNVLVNDSLVTVSKSYVEEIYDSLGKKIDGFIVHDLWVITSEEMVYDTLRPVNRVYQWLYEGSNRKEVGQRLIADYVIEASDFIFEKEIWYEYSIDVDNNIYVQETIGDYINGKWEPKTMPKKPLNK